MSTDIKDGKESKVNDTSKIKELIETHKRTIIKDFCLFLLVAFLCLTIWIGIEIVHKLPSYTLIFGFSANTIFWTLTILYWTIEFGVLFPIMLSIIHECILIMIYDYMLTIKTELKDKK